MSKILKIGISLFLVIIVGGCGNDEAKRKYEQEKQKLEEMRADHKAEINVAIASGYSEPQILILMIEHADAEMKQAELVYKLAVEAGMDE